MYVVLCIQTYLFVVYLFTRPLVYSSFTLIRSSNIRLHLTTAGVQSAVVCVLYVPKHTSSFFIIHRSFIIIFLALAHLFVFFYYFFVSWFT